MNFHDQTEFRAILRNDRIEKLADQYHLAAVLALRRPTERPYVAALDAAALYGLARQVEALAVKECNVSLTERDERRRERLREKIEIVAGWYGLTAKCYGDPRGYVVRLHGEGLPQNGWGGGFGVA
ncbi:MAG: hypothetical protein A3E78_12255 [Alphaproteobacteria bacterium RIFCSPHIGHO2_12_FULL_63_12]|nr:MAG: hypothetical protein A3E78_12255 [Alphaproteobacteria bacterium RIFCSPHIGHO2_12_FULL_63_12]